MTSDTETPRQHIREHLAFLYGQGETSTSQLDAIAERLFERMDSFQRAHPQLSQRGDDSLFSEDDAVLITYGDSVIEADKAPLQSLRQLLVQQAGDTVSGVHILPFYPYTSDDGFSVVDYLAVDPALGNWADVRALGEHFDLMFDAVINHISQASEWFQGFVRGEAPYVDYFVTADVDVDLSQVVRPRTLPLLTPVETTRGEQHVWTTFSPDQIDINYGNPEVLLEIADVLLHYVANGARLIRLDAIAFMWKEIGTRCIHLPETHRVIQLYRAVMDEVAPAVVLITETNVPHKENISYFGDGNNEAQMVYNFSLPPLTLHAFATGDASVLQRWAESLRTPSARTTYFNFMASHDGIGLRPVEGILSTEEVAQLVERVERHGGLVSYKTNSDGSQSPYELNITYFDALNDASLLASGEETLAQQVDRFLCSQAILVVLEGVPGIYIHSLFGSRNWSEGVAETGRNRTINREKLRRAELERDLADPEHRRARVFARYRQLLRVRRGQAAFHPNGRQRILSHHEGIFAFLRTPPAGATGRSVLCLHNVTGAEQTLRLAPADLDEGDGTLWRDLFSEASVRSADGVLSFSLPAYGVGWYQPV